MASDRTTLSPHRRTSKVPPLVLMHPFLPELPSAFHVCRVYGLWFFPFWMVSFHRAVPLQSALGKGEQGAELRGLGTGVKTVTPTFCPDMKDELEIPKTNLYYLLN